MCLTSFCQGVRYIHRHVEQAAAGNKTLIPTPRGRFVTAFVRMCGWPRRTPARARSLLRFSHALLSMPVSISPAPEPLGPASQPLHSNTGPLGSQWAHIHPESAWPAFPRPRVRSSHRSAASLHTLCSADQRLAALTQQSRQGPPSHTAPYHMTAPLCYPAPSRPHGPSLAACPT